LPEADLRVAKKLFHEAINDFVHKISIEENKNKKIKQLDEFAKDKSEEQLVQIRVHQLALAKV
jgi:hypothetical protein